MNVLYSFTLIFASQFFYIIKHLHILEHANNYRKKKYKHNNSNKRKKSPVGENSPRKSDNKL